MKLASLSPRGSIEKAIKAKRGRAWPYRPESRLIQTEAARARVAAGFRRVEQRHVPKPNDGSELSREDRQVLSLRIRGLWPGEIAVLVGIRVQSVRYRLERLRKAGLTFPPPTAPRPIPHRKVTDDEVLTLARSGLSIPEIAAKVGMATPTVHKRIKRLQERVNRPGK
jgi:DNA-binding CsgD family transcriptional regulator